ncbi:SGNH/GDSL hydrolase family protein [Sphingomonas aquatilis]|uniref:SGNH/GDSL hydrolase family protein n=1 Tax=Sphingomonas aquatilis TaxID=93063 RepID=UPI0023F981F7|nr:SGNH/GDSL hydrolase family protein [Sphingomonas aquatilis]MCI4653135.1 SGNH/GDSL hydrolase family protein [Sphingomonas aquatilis]
MNEVINATVGGLRGPGLTGADKALFDQRVADAQAASSMVNRALGGALDTKRNLFDKTRRTLGFLNGDGSINANGGFYTSDFIPILPGGQITANAAIVGAGSGYVCVYDASLACVGSMQKSGGGDYPAGQPITAPNTASIRYIRVSAAVGVILPAALTVAPGATPLPAFRAFGMIDRYSTTRSIAAALATLGQRNLFDPAGIIDDSLLDATNDTVAAAAGYYVTNYMPIFEGQSLIFAQGMPIGQTKYGLEWLDIDLARISSVNAPLQANTSYLAPPGAAYARCSVSKSDTPIAVFAAYVGTAISAEAVSGPIADRVGAAQLSRSALFAGQSSETNLFDPKRVTRAAYRNIETGEVVANPAACFTHDMPLMPGLPVILSAGNTFGIDKAGLAWLDYFGRIIGKVPPPLVAGMPYMPPKAACGWFANYPIDAPPVPFFGVGTTLPVGYRGSGNVDASRAKTFANLNWVGLGDSIMAQGKWAIVAHALMRTAKFQNWGVSGSKMADILTGRSAADFAAFDLCAISSSTNDFGAQTPLGQPTDAPGAATFYGVTKLNIETLRGWKPDMRTFLTTPLHRGDEFKPQNGGPIVYPLRAYRDAILECGLIYSVPVYDQYARSGIGPGNFATYMQADQFDNLHPNDLGGRLIGRQLATWIEGLGSGGLF